MNNFFFWHSIFYCLCLFLLFFGCSPPAYRLDGKVVDGVSEVSLLDSAAVSVIDSLRKKYFWSDKALEHSHKAVLDSLSLGTASVEEEFLRLKNFHETAYQRYRQAFEKMYRFKSFAGNLIFSTSDLEMKTSVLLEKIADRSYRGKTFSLETEVEIRRYIQNQLLGIEKSVFRTQSQMVRLKGVRDAKADSLKKIESNFSQHRERLKDDYNQKMLKGLQESILYQTAVDKAQEYRFFQIPVGTYYLFVSYPLPEAWLVRVNLNTHTRRNLGAETRQTLLIPEFN